MGFVSTLVINNDLLNDVKKDKSFGEKVHHAVLRFSNSKPEPHINCGPGTAATLIDCHHASYGVPFIIGGGMFYNKISNIIISEGSKNLEIDLLKNLADKHGFDLHRKRKK